MKTNVWLDDEVTSILQDARDKLERLGAVVEIAPASVHGEGVVASLLVSSNERSVHASYVVFEMGHDVIASRGHDEFDERVKQRMEDRAADAASALRGHTLAVGTTVEGMASMWNNTPRTGSSS